MFNLRRALKTAPLCALLFLSAIPPLFADSIVIFSDPTILRNKFVDISQKWDYYESELVSPDDFYPRAKIGAGALVSFPHEMEKEITVASYHARLTGLQPFGRYSSDFLGAAMTSSRIWCNGKIVATGGFLSKEKDTCLPGELYSPVDFQADKNGVVDIVIHIANFEKCKGGIAKKIKITEISRLRMQLSVNYFLNMLLFAFILAHIIYNILLGTLNFRQTSHFILVFICLLYCCVLLLTGHTLILQRAAPLPFWLQRKIALATLGFLTALDSVYILNMLRVSYKKTLTIAAIAAAIAITALAIPLDLFESGRWIFASASLAISFICFSMLMRFVLKRNLDNKKGFRTSTAAYNLSSFVMLIIFFCRVNDFLVLPQTSTPIHSFIAFRLSILFFGLMECGIYAFNRDYSNVRVARQMEKLSITNNALSKIVPQQVLKLLGANDITKIIPGECRIIDAILFYAEIKHFNRLAESIEKEDLYSIQAEFLKMAAPIIIDCGGFVAKYTNAGCIAIFQQKNSDAIICASRLQKKVRDIRRELRKTKRTDISIGIAIHSGKVAIGTIGSNTRLDTMALSEDVNITYAVGKHTSKTNTQILITEEAMPYCRNYINYVYEGHYFISNGKQILVYSALQIKKGDQSFEDTLEPIEEEDEN